MGGRGGKSKVNSQTQANANIPDVTPAVVYNPPPVQRNQPQTNKTQQEIIDFVKNQIGVDLNDYRNTGTAIIEKKRSKFVNIDWKRMPKTVQQQLSNLSIQYPGSQNAIALVDTSGWSKMVYFKNR